MSIYLKAGLLKPKLYYNFSRFIDCKPDRNFNQIADDWNFRFSHSFLIAY